MSKNIKNISELDTSVLESYTVEYSQKLDDISSLGIVLRHKKSGARVCVISNDDENKVFFAAFRTPPANSTGVPHIIEHTVLCGSKNYPSRDPFMQLAKGSLNTFLNAVTYPDKTMYPVASCNDKDFKNLMNVYMDAVFYPNIYKYKQIFMQEGWHYELENAEDELTVNGIVYSEMKGALSTPDRAIYDELTYELFPDNTYGVNSGGDPDVIPSLTYEDYLDFHRKYYHPSNSYILLYGDNDVEERLTWLDKNYLSSFDKIEVDSHIEPQKPFGGMHESTRHYSLANNENPEGKSYFAYAALCGSILDTEEGMAWEILSDVLLNSPGAPVKQALLDAGIGQDIYGGFYDHMLQPAFTIIAKNTKAEDRQRFYDIIRETLEKQVKDGINQKSLLATINIREFKYREADFGSYPKGLAYGTDMLQSWLYDDSAAFIRMKGNELYASLKAKIGTDYYENLIKKYLLESDHAILLSLEPEKGLLDRKNEELKKKLAEYKSSLSPEEINKIIAETKALRDYQSAEPTEEELNCIPSLNRSDIKREAQDFIIEKRDINGIKTLYHDIYTNGISYLRLMFDIGDMPAEYIPYLGILGSVLGKVDTANHTFKDLSDDIKINTGGIGYGTGVYCKFGEKDNYRPIFEIAIDAMADKLEYALDLVTEVLTTSKFEDTKRLNEILGQVISGKQSYISSSGNSVAAARTRSYFTKRGCFLELLSGISCYEELKKLSDNYEERKNEFSAKLKALTGYIFKRSAMFIDITSDEAGYSVLANKISSFADALDKNEHTPLGAATDFKPERKNEGFMMALGVQYLASCGNLFDAGYEYNGSLKVLATALNYDYLYNMIRVKGGAYGCGCGFFSDTGDVIFTSYRDPKLAETKEVYEKASEFVRELNPDESELTKYIIGTFSGFERPLSARQKAGRALTAYITGKTIEDVQKERNEMLDTTVDDLRSAAEMLDAIIAQNYSCALGNEQKLRENADMFDNLVPLS